MSSIKQQGHLCMCLPLVELLCRFTSARMLSRTAVLFMLCGVPDAVLSTPVSDDGEKIQQETTVSAHLDYFPSRLHAAIYRNWEIVPLERLAGVLQTTIPTLLQAGAEIGLSTPAPLKDELVRRNYETVLRRNWPVLPRAQIEALLALNNRRTETSCAPTLR